MMKKTKIYRNAMLLMAAIIMATITASCSDWDDHYDANSSETASSSSTLWENISNNSNLSQFTDLVKKVGYKDILNTTQVYTVWAPLNDTFDYSTLINTDSATVLLQFIKNHVARYNYPASGAIDEDIYMLNSKVEEFSGSGSYTFGGISVDSANIPSSNGVLHTLDGKVPFFPNIYEYLSEDDYAIDSIGNYFYSFDTKVLNVDESVEGPTVDGEITYLDSVFDESNSLYSRLGYAYINREDSNYTMILPTNTAWDKAYDTISSCYNYIPSFKFTDLSASTTTTVTIDDEYMKDSLVKYQIVRNLVFNNNMYSNSTLETLTASGSVTSDSLVTTTGNRIFGDDMNSLFEGATKETMSNGYVWVTDSLRMRPWFSWNQKIKLEAESNIYRANVLLGKAVSTSATSSAINSEVTGTVSSSYYIDVVPTSSSANPEVDFYLPDILSTTYNIYCVFVPANILSDNVDKILPNKVRFTIGYNDANGNIKTKTINTVTSTVGKVDTVYVGEFTFPIAYKGLDSYYPYLKLKSSVLSSETSSYDREMRIDCLILVPKELDDYISLHPDYKYYSGGSH